MPLPQEFHDLAAKVRNWGRWGDDDRIGTINHITPDAIRRGRDSVVDGRAISLAVPLQLEGIQIGIIRGRVNPLRTMIAVNHAAMGDPEGFCTSDDVVFMGLQAATHWDGLGHVSYGGTLYNGFPASTIDEWGCHSLGISNIRSMTSRGVLLDVARAKGLDELPPAYAITADDLDAAAELGKVEVRQGDIILIRTGRMAHYHRGGGMAYCLGADGQGGNAGPSLQTVEWFHRKEVAAVANDTLTFEVFPSENPAAMLAVHLLHLVDMGLTQGQNFDLETLAEDCAVDGRYTFLLAANPEPFVGGVGSPVNPVAIK